MFKVELRTCLYQFWIYEDNELQWEHQLERMLSVLHQDDHEILSDKKSSLWERLSRSPCRRTDFDNTIRTVMPLIWN